MGMFPLQETVIHPDHVPTAAFRHYPADTFPLIHPIHWLTSHFAVGGWSPLQRLSGMLTAHMTQIAPRNGFTWHPHRGLEIYTWVLEGELHHEDTTGGYGVIGAGAFQRMFAGDYIEHQELHKTDVPTRVVQIWYVADRHHQGLPPHYQQLEPGELPSRQHCDAQVFSLIGDGSPMEQHMQGRLTAGFVPPDGRTTLEAPTMGEDMFVYVTDGSGEAAYDGTTYDLGQYNVMLARPTMAEASLRAGQDGLNYLSFYLPAFLG